MRVKLVKVLSLLFVLCVIIASSVFTSGAISYSNDVKTESESILLVNMDTNQVVFEKDPDAKNILRPQRRL